MHTHATPTFITKVLHVVTHVQLTVKVKLMDYSASLLLLGLFLQSSSMMPTNNADYSCHIQYKSPTT